MEIGAVAYVLEDVLGFGEGRLADPGTALAAHVGIGTGIAVHPDRHGVAADAAERTAAVRHLGRGVVRTAGAEPGLPLGRCRWQVGTSRAGIEPGARRGQTLFVGVEAL